MCLFCGNSWNLLINRKARYYNDFIQIRINQVLFIYFLIDGILSSVQIYPKNIITIEAQC